MQMQRCWVFLAILRDCTNYLVLHSFFFFLPQFILSALPPSEILPFYFSLSLSSSVSSRLRNAFTRYWANKSRARGCYPGREGVPVGAGWLAGCCSRVHWPTSACCWVGRSSLPFSYYSLSFTSIHSQDRALRERIRKLKTGSRKFDMETSNLCLSLLFDIKSSNK